MADSIHLALMDPRLSSQVMHDQFCVLIGLANENRTLAAQGALRPFDDSMQGIAAVVYLTDILFCRIIDYRRDANQGVSTVELAEEIILRSGRHRGADVVSRLLARLGEIKRSVAVTAEYMKDLSIVMHLHNF